MRASGHSLTSLRLGPTPGDAYDWEDLHAQEQQHAEQHSHAEQQRHALGQHERISPVFLQHYPQLQQLHLERANWNLSSLNPSWLTALRTLTVHHSHCTASDFEFLAHITPQLQELSLYVLNQGGCTLNFSFSAAQSIHLVLDRHSVHLNLALPASLKSLSVSADSLDLECHSDPPLSLDFLMLIGRKRLVVSSLPLASAKDVYLNAPSMHEESFDPLTNPPCPLQSSPSHHFKSRELYASSVSESSLIRVLQSVAPTVEALMVPHSLPIEAVEGEWRALHRLAIGTNRPRSKLSQAMASDGKKVLEEMSALNLASPSDAANYRESLDVVDFLPGPIWHIIFRHLLLPPTDSTELQNQGNSLAELQEREGSISSVDTSPDSASDQHEENARCFGSSWPLLRCAMASKRLLHHVISFSEVEPISLVQTAHDSEWNKTLFWFLQQPGHKSLDLDFRSLKDLQTIGDLIASSAHSLASLSLEIEESANEGEVNHFRTGEISPAFLENFGQLQRLKLGCGRWSLNAAWFKALRSLSIEYVSTYGDDYFVLSSLSPQLYEFSLTLTSHGSNILDFEFTVARVITLSFRNRKLEARFSLPASLKTLSLTAASLHVDCKCDSPLALDSLKLVGRHQLSISSLPLASVGLAVLNGPATNDDVDPPSIPLSGSASRLALTQLLSSIAPTVETLLVKHGWPLEDVDAEWSRLRCLGIGVRGNSGGGECDMVAIEDEEDPYDLLSRGSRREVIRPPFINAPALKFFYFPTRQFQPETLASLRRHFPSLAWYHIVGRLFLWDGKGEQRRKEPLVLTLPSPEVPDDWTMRFLQTFLLFEEAAKGEARYTGIHAMGFTSPVVVVELVVMGWGYGVLAVRLGMVGMCAVWPRRVIMRV
ncbi:unnamed protein product [Closterium sp. Yama58-4]|nr:unnamed protein product [Closterium sp. Yama58-4]